MKSTFNRPLRVSITVLLVVVALAALVFCLKLKRDSVKDDSSVATTPAQNELPSPATPLKQSPVLATNIVIQWGGVGDVHNYRASYALRMIPTSRESFDVSAPISNATITGYYHVRVLSTGAEDVVLGTQFSGTEIKSMDRAKVLEQFLNTTPVAIRFSRQGRILGYHLPATIGTMDRQFIIGMNCVQIVLAPGKSWTANETDGAGEYSALYSKLGKGQIAKQKLKYLSLRNASSEETMPIVHSSFLAWLGSFWLESYRGREISTLTIAGTAVLTTESDVDLERSKDDVQPPPQLKSLVADSLSSVSFTNAWPTEAVLSNEKTSAWTDQVDANIREKYKNVPFQQVYTDLLDANQRSQFHADHLPAILALKDWLLVHPDGATELSTILKNGELSSELAAQLIHSLELSSANGTSQKALADLLDPLLGYPSSVQVQAAVAAGGLEGISPSLCAALLKMAFDPTAPSQEGDYAPQNAALLALGTLARNNQTIADTLAEKLIHNLDPTIHTEADLTVVGLLTLKNGAIYNKDLLKAAESLFVSSEDEHIRVAALEYVAGSKTDNGSLIERALDDPNDAVRIRSLELLAASKNVSETGIARALDILRNPKENEQLRMTAVDLLSPRRGTDRRVSSLLEQIAASEPGSAIAERIEQSTK